MSQKKATTKRSPKGSAASKKQTTSLDARAQAIIADGERYDVDTRAAIKLALSNFKFYHRGGDDLLSADEARKGAGDTESELRDLVTRAEAGERVVESGAGAEADEVARRVIELLDLPGRPDFLLNGLMTVLHAAQEVSGAKLWITIDPKTDEPELSADRLARVISHNEASHIEFERKRDLAGLISGVLNHPDTPPPVYNFLHDGINETLNHFTQDERVAYDNSPGRIANVLAFVKEKEGDA